jgi:hypothetical protein
MNQVMLMLRYLCISVYLQITLLMTGAKFVVTDISVNENMQVNIC